ACRSPSSGCPTMAAVTSPARHAASLATSASNREPRRSKVHRAMEWLKPSSAPSSVIMSASVRARMQIPSCTSYQLGSLTTTRFTRTRHSDIVHPVSSSQLTETRDHVRSFGGYNRRLRDHRGALWARCTLNVCVKQRTRPLARILKPYRAEFPPIAWSIQDPNDASAAGTPARPLLYLSSHLLNGISPPPICGLGHVVQTYIQLKGSHLVWRHRYVRRGIVFTDRRTASSHLD